MRLLGYVVVWAAGRAVKALRVSDSGVPIDAAPLTVGNMMPLASLGVAVAGSTILVVWNDQQHILGGRVAAGGAILDAAPIVIGDGWSADVASNGTQFAVAWTGGSGGGTLARRLAPSGALDGIAVVDLPAREYSPWFRRARPVYRKALAARIRLVIEYQSAAPEGASAELRRIEAAVALAEPIAVKRRSDMFEPV